MGTTSWPPTGRDFFLRPASPHRPLFQGDVYEDVPFVTATYGGDPSLPPGTSVERRAVAVLGCPCDLFADGRPVKVQTVAPIVNAEKVGIPDSWAGAYTYVPLPDVYGDGVRWAVALQASASIDAPNLRRDQRTAALSELGWALFRQRLALRDAPGTAARRRAPGRRRAAVEGAGTVDDVERARRAARPRRAVIPGMAGRVRAGTGGLHPPTGPRPQHVRDCARIPAPSPRCVTGLSC